MKYVSVVFSNTNSTKRYDFKCLNDEVKVDDLVVVDTRNGYALAIVVEVKDSVSTKACKYVVQVVDTEEFDKQLKRDQLRVEIEQELERKMAERNRLEQYELAAKNDPAMAELLEKYKSL